MGKSKRLQSEELRVAVIGCGAIGSLHAQAVVRSKHAQLTATCDVEPERAELVAASTSANTYNDVEELLSAEPLDVVTVATPENLHMAPVVKSIEAGCHVFCEKPMASTFADAQRMTDAAARHSRHLAIDYNRRFGFGYLKAKELCANGAVGDSRDRTNYRIEECPGGAFNNTERASPSYRFDALFLWRNSIGTRLF